MARYCPFLQLLCFSGDFLGFPTEILVEIAENRREMAAGELRKAYVHPCRWKDRRSDLSIRARLGGRSLLWRGSENPVFPTWAPLPNAPDSVGNREFPHNGTTSKSVKSEREM